MAPDGQGTPSLDEPDPQVAQPEPAPLQPRGQPGPPRPIDMAAELREQDRALAAGEGAAVLAELLERLDARPDEPALHYLRGRLLGNLGELEDARAAFARALELDDELAWAHHGMGIYLHKQGELTEARDAFARARELDADEPVFAADLAKQLHLTGQRDEALALMDRAIEMGDAAALYADRARMHADAGARGKAIADMQTALQRDPRSYDAYMYLAKLLLLEGRDREAIRVYERLVDRVENPVHRSLARARIEQLQEAMERDQLRAVEDADPAELIAQLSGPDKLERPQRRKAYERLGGLGRLADLKHLMLGLLDEDWMIRKHCVAGLARTGHPDVVPVLLKVLRLDASFFVRGEAASALETLGSAALIPDLIAVLKREPVTAETEDYVIRKLVKALRGIAEEGPRDRLEYDDLAGEEAMLQQLSASRDAVAAAWDAWWKAR